MKDIDRILLLPRRDWRKGLGGAHGTTDKLIELLNRAYQKRERRGDDSPVTLWPQQAIALAEGHDFRGIFGPIPVGKGKTLVTLLYPRVVQAQRPLLVLPAALRDAKTKEDWEGYYLDWNVPGLCIEGQDYGSHEVAGPRIYVTSYKRLSIPSGKTFLDDFKPDLIMGDEAHKWSNKKATGTKRFLRYVQEHKPRVCLLSGTFMARTIDEYAHLLAACLDEGSPLPLNSAVVSRWSKALDDKYQGKRIFGDMTRLVPSEQTEELLARPLHTVRKAVGKRFRETPGVIAVDTEDAITALIVQPKHFAPKDSGWVKALADCRKDWVLPDGQEIADGFVKSSKLEQLALGFYYRWKTEPPNEWREARREWARYCRRVARYATGPGRDSEALIAGLCRQAWRATCAHVFEDEHCVKCKAKKDRKYSVPHNIDPETYLRWIEVKDQYAPEKEIVWVTDKVLNYVVEWLTKGGHLAWVSHVDFGHRLSEITGIPFFGGGNRDDIVSHEGPAIISATGKIEGLQLQRYSRNLIVSMRPCARWFEQLIGRTHRKGQQHTVYCDILVTVNEHVRRFNECRNNAKTLKETGHGPQRLIDAADVLMRPPEKKWQGY